MYFRASNQVWSHLKHHSYEKEVSPLHHEHSCHDPSDCRSFPYFRRMQKRKKEPLPICISNLSISECLDNPQTKGWNDTIYVSAIDDTKLKIHTTHTPFNCCTTKFSQKINVQENDIIVTMHEDGDFCYCMCGHSVDFVLNNLEIGKTYTIILKHDNQE